MAPLSPRSNIRALLRAGADAFYCGLILPELKAELFGWSEETGRASPEANFDQYGLRSAIELCRTLGRPLYLTLNRQYPSKVVPGIREAIARAIECVISGLVVADLDIAAFVHENWPRMHMTAGTFMGLHNQGALKLASRMGFSRVVLPRVMRIEEIRLLSGAEGPGLEVFVGRERCRFLNAYCRLEHSMPGNETEGLNFSQAGLCATPMICEGQPYRMDDVQDQLIACGLCAIAMLRDLKRVESFKVVGRGFTDNEVIPFIELARRVIDRGFDSRKAV